MDETPPSPTTLPPFFREPARPLSGRTTLIFVAWGILSSALFYLPWLELPFARPGGGHFWGTVIGIGAVLMVAQAVALAVTMSSGGLGCLAFIVPEIVVPIYTVAIIVWYYRHSPMRPTDQLRQLWQAYRTKSRNNQIAIAAATLVATLLLCSGVGGVFAGGGLVAGEAAPSSTATHAATNAAIVSPSATPTITLAPTSALAPTATSEPTATPTLVVTAISPLADAAVLGGPESAFEAKFGVSNNSSQPPDVYNFGVSNFLMVSMNLGVTGNFGPAAESIIASATDKNPMASDVAHSYCLSYAPSDATYVKQVAYTDASGVEGVDYVYQSNMLAKVFPANAFQDKNSNILAPGTFDVQLLYTTPNDSSQIDSCSLALGFTQY